MRRPTRRMRWTGALASFAFLPVIGIGACESGAKLQTATFELQYMNPSEAMHMIAPYVYPEREGAAGMVTDFSTGITVRETAENLERIRQVLEQYDVATPAVRLHFQLIEADGFEGTDPRIADVRAALEELFRFDGYRLVAEPQMAAMEGTGSSQVIGERPGRFYLQGRVVDVRGRGEKGSVVLEVELSGDQGTQIQTSMAVPVGETVVLGSSQGVGQSTIILTVRPEFVNVP